MENRKLLKRGRRGRVFRITRPAGGNTLETRTTPCSRVVPGRRTRGRFVDGRQMRNRWRPRVYRILDRQEQKMRNIFLPSLVSPPLRACVRGSSRYPRLGSSRRCSFVGKTWNLGSISSCLYPPDTHRENLPPTLCRSSRRKKREKNLYRWRRRFTCILSGEGEVFDKDARGQLFPRRRLIVASIKQTGEKEGDDKFGDDGGTRCLDTCRKLRISKRWAWEGLNRCLKVERNNKPSSWKGAFQTSTRWQTVDPGFSFPREKSFPSVWKFWSMVWWKRHRGIVVTRHGYLLIRFSSKRISPLSRIDSLIPPLVRASTYSPTFRIVKNTCLRFCVLGLLAVTTFLEFLNFTCCTLWPLLVEIHGYELRERM